MGLNNLPLIGPWKKKITKIQNVAIIDCVPNGFVVITGIAVAAFHVFWAVSGPECIDSTWDRTNKPGRKHRKFKANGTSFGPAITAQKGSLANSLIPVGDMAQKIGFFFGIVDGALDGIYYGSSLISRYTGCINPDRPYAELSMTNAIPNLLPPSTFICASWIVGDFNTFGADASGVATDNDPNSEINVACDILQSFGTFPTLPDCEMTWRVVWLPSGEPVRQHYGGLGYNMKGTGTFFGQDILRHGTDAFIAVEMTKSYGVLTIGTAFLSVTGGRITGNVSAYTCGAKAQAPG